MSNLFAGRFPQRFFNIGIAEPCMVDVAVGLALGGRTPFVNGFAALLSLRALEQIRTCVCYARTNVKLVAGYAGLSDFKDGATHHAIMDIATLRAMPNITVIVAADGVEAGKWVPIVAEHDGPVYLRLSRAASGPLHDETLEVEIGKGITLRQGSDVTIIGTGLMVYRCMRAAKILAEAGIDARVLEIHTLKPLDLDLVREAAEETGALVTAEEHSVIGGLGGAVAEALGGCCPVPIERVGIADTFCVTAPDVESLLDNSGLAVADVVEAARRVTACK